MSLLINIIIALVIVSIATAIIIKTVKQSSKDKCGGCEYQCETKMLLEKEKIK